MKPRIVLVKCFKNVKVIGMDSVLDNNLGSGFGIVHDRALAVVLKTVKGIVLSKCLKNDNSLAWTIFRPFLFILS